MFDEAEAAWTAYAVENEAPRVDRIGFIAGWRARVAFDAEAKATASEKRSVEFQKKLAEVRESFRLMRLYCIGCTDMKHEGARSYAERAPVCKTTGHCTRCGKPWMPKKEGGA